MSLLFSLSNNDVEEELSHAYLAAVCAWARMGVQKADRTKDNRGIDASISAFGPFGPNDGYLSTVNIDVQLKATASTTIAETETHYSYFVDSVSQYDVLRSRSYMTPRILVVLFLPHNFEEWIGHSHEQLLLRRCAYWVSLLGAEPCDNKSGQTVYLPKNQSLSPLGLLDLCSQLSRLETPIYQLP